MGYFLVNPALFLCCQDILCLGFLCCTSPHWSPPWLLWIVRGMRQKNQPGRKGGREWSRNLYGMNLRVSTVMKHHGQVWLTLKSTTEGSQSRTLCSTGTWSQELTGRLWRNTAYWLAHLSACLLTYFRTTCQEWHYSQGPGSSHISH